ncbi:hypothetical protein HanXRQr2_Chr15g0670961 [Helianthus annuus]|uniref:Uncharacterized protein n=1 Tax=Helianthus annuus TaxID=4232 RepID=A0A9K3DX15_HELAN|nr:hypothetical protein HanXRQr2_Chr15g0670961 [Helianthus annuus]KAJ0829441.1 hypothetical protein HanPSC8_Chr15g0644011 [Helianthus annuus]
MSNTKEEKKHKRRAFTNKVDISPAILTDAVLCSSKLTTTKAQSVSYLPKIYLFITAARSYDRFGGVEDTLVDRSSVARKLIEYAS